MKLRKLQIKDVPFMLEWMHDTSVVKDLQTDFSVKTAEDCKRFINVAQDMSSDMHLAIVDENDEYMGTVSLKHINEGKAEFAITVRNRAMGYGYSKFGMEEILKIGFNELRLKEVYWCVNPYNERAVRFYDKNGYKRINIHGSLLKNASIMENYSYQQINDYIWYAVINLHPDNANVSE